MSKGEIQQQLEGLNVRKIQSVQAANNSTQFEEQNKISWTLNDVAYGLQQLEILNAGENKLTDKSVGTFKKLPLLKRINLWQTGITEEAAKDLQSQSKNIVVER